MYPVVTLVGRENVGKSTLFNVLTRTRDALVADEPGLTRDRHYGYAEFAELPFIVVDTGGLVERGDEMVTRVNDQVAEALTEADVIFFLVDAKAGLMPFDEVIARRLRTLAKPIYLIVNKTDGAKQEYATLDFHRFGFGYLQAISASHNRGIQTLLNQVVTEHKSLFTAASTLEVDKQRIQLAIVGKPNVGKSTLVNRLLGEERVVVCDRPGTTRDTIAVDFDRRGKQYTLIDTAGVRRRSKVSQVVEKFSVIKTLKAIEAANVVLMMIDARDNISEQDLKLLSHVLERGCSLVFAINKWDGMAEDDKQQVKAELERRLHFIDFADFHFISALHGTGVGNIFKSVDAAYAAATTELKSSHLTELLERAVQQHQPPLVQGRRVKLRFAHPGGENPPTIIIHGNQTSRLPAAYKTYLINFYRRALSLVGTPIRLSFNTSDNPFAGRRNKLTPRQQRKRTRIVRHRKRDKA